MASELERLGEVMHALRHGCPWDAEQTHRSLVRYLVEESAEVVEAIESGADDHLCEELGDLLLQVFFHAEIAAEEGRFTIEDVARGIADKLVARHPYVFADSPVPDDVLASWEQRKRAEKGRSSALDGIPVTLPALARAGRVVARARAAQRAFADASQERTDQAVRALAWLGPEKAEAALKTLKHKLPSSTFGELVAAAPQLPSWLARSVGKVAHG